MHIFRHDKVMRRIMKDTQNGSLGNHYCKTDVGTTVAMKEY
jgi:hypothetical protein